MTRRLQSLAELAMTGLLYFSVTTTLAQGYGIPTGSTEGTLLIGDRLIVDKVSYAPTEVHLNSFAPESLLTFLTQPRWNRIPARVP